MHTNEIISAALPRLALRQRRAVEALAARRPVALPLTEGEILDMIERLNTGMRWDLEPYYALLDALATMQPRRLDASRQDMEYALQGVWERGPRP